MKAPEKDQGRLYGEDYEFEVRRFDPKHWPEGHESEHRWFFVQAFESAGGWGNLTMFVWARKRTEATP